MNIVFHNMNEIHKAQTNQAKDDIIIAFDKENNINIKLSPEGKISVYISNSLVHVESILGKGSKSANASIKKIYGMFL